MISDTTLNSLYCIIQDNEFRVYTCKKFNAALKPSRTEYNFRVSAFSTHQARYGNLENQTTHQLEAT